MPPKKGFEAFLKKNQKKGTKAAKTEEVTDAQAAEVKADSQAQKDEVKNTPATKKQNNEDSDEEEDELELATKQKVSYGTVKENKDIVQKKDKNEDQVGYGLDETKEEKKATGPVEPKKAGAAFGEGSSFGRPTFGGRKIGGGGPKGNFAGGDFSSGLDDLDKPQKNTSSQKTAAVEETKTESKGPVKPTFRGKMNVGGASRADDANSGVKTNYDFGVVYSTKRVEGEGGEKAEGEAREPRGPFEGQQHTRTRKTRDHGTEFGKEKKQDEDEDNDFMIVRDPKTRAKKTREANSDSDEEENTGYRGGFRGGDRGSRVFRGGERGGGDRGGERGGSRGGFFKNSSKRTE